MVSISIRILGSQFSASLQRVKLYIPAFSSEPVLVE